MDRRQYPRAGAWLLLALFLCAGALIPLSGDVTTPVRAAPHTTREQADPYDPDWPDVYMIVMSKCSGCHRAGGENFDLTSYDAIMAAQGEEERPIVVPGRPNQSTFYTKVLWNVRAERDSDWPDEPEMPEDHVDWLTACQIAIFERWIAGGARQFRLGASRDHRPLTEMDFPSAKICKQCHPKEYREWSRSMHAYAQHSPTFEAFNLALQERTSGTIGTFCSRCHSPIGTALGEDGRVSNVRRSRVSMEGVSCVVCHRQSRSYHKSNGRTALVSGTLLETCMFGPFEDGGSEELKTHKSVQLPHIRSSAFCGACHDVTSPSGLRLEEAFSEWQNSPAAREGITCQQCHMGPVQGVPIAQEHWPLGHAANVPGVDPRKLPLRRLTDHTFAGPDYSMLPDTEFPEKLDWMYEVDYRDWERLTPYQQKTLTDLRRKNRKQLAIADEKRYELLRNAATMNVAAPPGATSGEKIKVHVDITSKVSGHSFPTGFTAERQAWVEITLRDAAGRVIFASGDLDKNNDLRDSHSRAVESGKVARDKYLLNFQNKFIALTTRGTERSVVLSVNRHLRPLSFVRPASGISASHGRPLTFRIAKGSLPPLKTAGRTYPIRVPDHEGDCLLTVRFNFRHLPPVLLDEIGTPHLKRQLEIVVIEEHRSVIRVSKNRTALHD